MLLLMSRKHLVSLVIKLDNKLCLLQQDPANLPLEIKSEYVSKDVLDVVALKAITCYSFLFHFRYMDKRLSCEYITTDICNNRTKLYKSLGLNSWLTSMHGQNELSP